MSPTACLMCRTAVAVPGRGDAPKLVHGSLGGSEYVDLTNVSYATLECHGELRGANLAIGYFKTTIDLSLKNHAGGGVHPNVASYIQRLR